MHWRKSGLTAHPVPPARIGWQSESVSSHYWDAEFLTLPNLVLELIFSHLTLTDLLTLRITCKATKAFIDSHFLDKIGFTVRSRKTLRSLLSPHSTAWTKLTFQKLCLNKKEFQLFTSLHSEHLHSLHFTHGVYDSCVLRLISSCREGSLRCLIIEEIVGTNLLDLPEKERQELSLACRNLEHLGLFEILSDDPKGAEFYIQYILSPCCQRLKSLVIPFLTFSPMSPFAFNYAWDKESGTSTTPTDLFIVRPLISILENAGNAPEFQSVIVVPESRQALSDSALFCLSLLCYHRHFNLVYDKLGDSSEVRSLGRLKYSLSCEPQMQMSEIASKIMTVMASTTDILLNYEFCNLRKLVVQFSTFHIEKDIFVVQGFPRLTTLNIDFKMRKHPTPRCSKLKRMDMFVQGLLEVGRPSVKNLTVQNHKVVEKVISFGVEKVVGCFYNLRSLSLVGYSGGEGDWPRLWRGLRLLENVEVENCPGLNDKGLLGEDWVRPAILELTDLRSLKLSRTGRITDLSYIIAFSRMRLIKFHHQPLYQSDVTFEAYNSLSEGDFAKTVRFLSGSLTDFGRCTKTGLKDYLGKFPALQNSERKKLLQNFSRWRHQFGPCFAIK